MSVTTGTIGLIGATAMAGAIGAGGVGDLALTYGYERLNFPLMLFTVVILIVLYKLFRPLVTILRDELVFLFVNQF